MKPWTQLAVLTLTALFAPACAMTTPTDEAGREGPLGSAASASQTSDKVVSHLNGATASGGDDNRDDAGTGTKLEWRVALSDVIATVQVDKVDSETGIHLEKFTVTGKWSSHVRKDNFLFGVRVDKIWGDDKNPYGSFTLDLKALDGEITVNARVDVGGFPDEPNEYARSHAEGLIRSTLSQLH